jgi:hypothetical protein
MRRHPDERGGLPDGGEITIGFLEMVVREEVDVRSLLNTRH